MLPPDVQAVIRKPERQRTPAEQKIADDYFPVLRIDTDKIRRSCRRPTRKRYKGVGEATGLAARSRRRAVRPALPAFWTVEVDPGQELEKRATS